jgi:hypothetical protein
MGKLFWGGDARSLESEMSVKPAATWTWVRASGEATGAVEMLRSKAHSAGLGRQRR